jgi:hypothetical protein
MAVLTVDGGPRAQSPRRAQPLDFVSSLGDPARGRAVAGYPGRRTSRPNLPRPDPPVGASNIVSNRRSDIPPNLSTSKD